MTILTGEFCKCMLASLRRSFNTFFYVVFCSLRWVVYCSDMILAPPPEPRSLFRYWSGSFLPHMDGPSSQILPPLIPDTKMCTILSYQLVRARFFCEFLLFYSGRVDDLKFPFSQLNSVAPHGLTFRRFNLAWW